MVVSNILEPVTNKEKLKRSESVETHTLKMLMNTFNVLQIIEWLEDDRYIVDMRVVVDTARSNC